MIVETEITPNPDTLKFLPGKKVSEVGSLEFLKDDKNIKIPLARKILSLGENIRRNYHTCISLHITVFSNASIIGLVRHIKTIIM